MQVVFLLSCCLSTGFTRGLMHLNHNHIDNALSDCAFLVMEKHFQKGSTVFLTTFSKPNGGAANNMDLTQAISKNMMKGLLWTINMSGNQRKMSKTKVFPYILPILKFVLNNTCNQFHSVWNNSESS